MPRWWRRKRRQEKADSPKDSGSGTGEPGQKGDGPKSARAAREAKAAAPREKPGAPHGRPTAPDPRPEPAAAESKPSATASKPAAAESTPAAPDASPEGPAEPGSGPEGAGVDDPRDAEDVDDSQEAEDAADAGNAGVSSLADKVQAVLVAAESTAERIRRAADVDAARIAEERERQRHAARELVHLERLADALSVQAESVKRQCGVLKALLPAVEDARDESAAAAGRALTAPEPDEPEGEVRIRDLRGDRGDGDAAEAREGEAGADAAEYGRRFPQISRERVEAYRMKLAGACRTDVEAYLVAAGVDEAAEITAELFDPLPSRPAG